ncbi:MAG: hypothetical protein QGF53_16070, partial [Alphaproteobacteria bacterium]|nr:hypothetical protein [Alphaproteobacteria bacterium]
WSKPSPAPASPAASSLSCSARGCGSGDRADRLATNSRHKALVSLDNVMRAGFREPQYLVCWHELIGSMREIQ